VYGRIIDKDDGYTAYSTDVVVRKAAATITVTGYSGTYDGAAHGATGTAGGVNGENLSGLLHLGDTFTNVPGGTAHWTFDGDNNYLPAAGDVAVTIDPATPAFSVPDPEPLVFRTPTVTLSGTLRAGSLVPTGSVTVSLAGVGSQQIPIAPDGTFSATFATAGLRVGRYPIKFEYGGDPNFTTATATSTLNDTYKVDFNVRAKAKSGITDLALDVTLTDVNGSNVSAAPSWVRAVGIAAADSALPDRGVIDPALLGTLPINLANDPFTRQGGALQPWVYKPKNLTGLTEGKTYRLYFQVEGDPLLHWVAFTA
jgi:hypothetical protein